jgi:NADH:ubiquinone oxidoreductase subunit C
VVETDELIARLGTIPGAASVAPAAGALWVSGARLDVEAMAEAMTALGFRLATVTATPQSVQGETTIIYHYVSPSRVINLKTETRNGSLASIATRARPAAWAEREIKDLYGVEFPGHPNLIPLLKPAEFEVGMLREAMCGPRRPTMSPTVKIATE